MNLDVKEIILILMNLYPQVKKKLVLLYKTPQDVESVMESAVETIKSWTTSVNTYHQIVEDVFEFVRY